MTQPEEPPELNPFEDNDVNDIAAVFRAYGDRPRDIVPKQPYTGSSDDLHQLEGQTVTYTELTDDGVTAATATITAPITGENA